MLKPEDMGGNVTTGESGIFGGSGVDTLNYGPASTTEVPQIDADVYDPVTETKRKEKH